MLILRTRLQKCNKGSNYVLFAKDVFSRTLRVESVKTKCSTDSRRRIKRITKNIPQKVWTDEGSEFKKDFKKFCDSKNIEPYNIHSGTKSALAERNIRSLKKNK